MRRVICGLILAATVSLAAADHGPDKGTLVIVGGNMQDPAIVKRFIDLAGGPAAPIVIIPTAGEADVYDQYYSGLKLWRENGATNLTVVHTRATGRWRIPKPSSHPFAPRAADRQPARQS